MKSLERIVFKKDPEKFIEMKGSLPGLFGRVLPTAERLTAGNTGRHLWSDSPQGQILFSSNIKRSSGNSTLHLRRFLN
jgi:hypothetical protein